jgi:hypothetical protein
VWWRIKLEYSRNKYRFWQIKILPLKCERKIVNYRRHTQRKGTYNLYRIKGISKENLGFTFQIFSSLRSLAAVQCRSKEKRKSDRRED